MRFLPYILVLAMGAPVFVWFLVSMSLKGSANEFGSGDMTVLVSLGVMMLVAFGLLATWMDKLIRKTN
ncbi:MAG TPA: hypothetical protein VLL76_10570 [Candidatus Omnitrophota bacterium]|nr:hypothetical protein [Candidatus Omnitrophota bacterium]